MTAELKMPQEPERFGVSPDGYGGREGIPVVWAEDYEKLRAHAEAQQREIERLNKCYKAIHEEYALCRKLLMEHSEKRESAESRIAELDTDAGRYRWLRYQYEDRAYAVFAWDDDCSIHGKELDAAIDADMKGQSHD